jgi:DNA-binding NarL/FixJ family response regulator
VGVALTVVIADDEAAVRAALVDLLSEHPALRVVGVAADAEAAVRLAEAIVGIRAVSPETRIVAYSAADDRAQMTRILTAGADRYVVKGANAYHLVEAILETAETPP